ncbi:hypothetical protein SMICM17S_01052 [Streptomyces microflavus]
MLSGADQDVDRAPARGDVPVDRQRGARDLHGPVAGQPAGQPVHGADELGDERRGGALVQLGRGRALLQAARVEDGDPVGHGEGLLLVVGDEDGGDAERELEAADLLAECEPDLGIECGAVRPGAASRARARARATRCCWPPDIWCGKRLPWSGSPTSSRSSPAVACRSAVETPHPGAEGHVVAGVEVREEAVATEDHPGVTPVGGDGVMSSPSTRTSPESGCSNPARTRSAVVLPQPEGPSRARSSPGSAVRSSPSRATVGPNARRRERNSTRAPVAARPSEAAVLAAFGVSGGGGRGWQG